MKSGETLKEKSLKDRCVSACPGTSSAKFSWCRTIKNCVRKLGGGGGGGGGGRQKKPNTSSTEKLLF